MRRLRFRSICRTCVDCDNGSRCEMYRSQGTKTDVTGREFVCGIWSNLTAGWRQSIVCTGYRRNQADETRGPFIWRPRTVAKRTGRGRGLNSPSAWFMSIETDLRLQSQPVPATGAPGATAPRRSIYRSCKKRKRTLFQYV